MRRILLSIILICVLTVPALAHPGGTDSSGGHTDHSTGEYHYHHGYGPHDHEDLDGDGDLDCPYNFKDKTEENSGESSGSSVEPPPYARPTSTSDQSSGKRNSRTNTGDIALLGILGAALYGLLRKMAKGPTQTSGRTCREAPAALAVFGIYAVLFALTRCLLAHLGVPITLPALPGVIGCVAALVIAGYYLTWIVSGILGAFSVKLQFASLCWYVFLSALWLLLVYIL